MKRPRGRTERCGSKKFIQGRAIASSIEQSPAQCTSEKTKWRALSKGDKKSGIWEEEAVTDVKGLN